MIINLAGKKNKKLSLTTLYRVVFFTVNLQLMKFDPPSIQRPVMVQPVLVLCHSSLT